MTARRRERRSTAAPKTPALSDQGSPTSRAASNRFRIPVSPLCFVLAAFSLATSIVVYVHNTPKSISPILSVHERGLIKPNIEFHEILKENARVSENRSRRHFPNPVLAYITPWNSRGYEMAKLFSSKLTHLSPVWYELRSEGKKPVLEGRHNADMQWINELAAKGQSLVLPRVVLEAFPEDLLLKKKQWSKTIDIILNECKVMGYDGIVLESWSRWAAYGVLHDPNMRSMGLQFIKKLGQALHSVTSMNDDTHHLELIYVIPAPRSQNFAEHDFGPEDLQQLCGSVDGFSLMTYDFSGPQSPGPNAPLDWVRSSLRLLLGDSDGITRSCSPLIFPGLNFYGNDFVLSNGLGGGAIVGREYLSLLEKHRPILQWEEKSAEHFFVYSDNGVRHAVFYPSLMSISMRMDEARAWGAGLSLWEIGQGLDFFFDLL